MAVFGDLFGQSNQQPLAPTNGAGMSPFNTGNFWGQLMGAQQPVFTAQANPTSEGVGTTQAQNPIFTANAPSAPSMPTTQQQQPIFTTQATSLPTATGQQPIFTAGASVDPAAPPKPKANGTFMGMTGIY